MEGDSVGQVQNNCRTITDAAADWPEHFTLYPLHYFPGLNNWLLREAWT